MDANRMDGNNREPLDGQRQEQHAELAVVQADKKATEWRDKVIPE